MQYRVYDTKHKEWIYKDIFMSQDGELFMSKKILFIFNKLCLLPQSRYVSQEFVGLHDRNNQPIYIGDYVEAQITEDKKIIGVITFANETSGYIILGINENKFYTLGEYVSEYINVIGNVFETSIEVEDND